MSAEDCEKLFDDMRRVRVFGFEALDWLVFDHTLSCAGDVSLAVHCEAMARGLGMPFRGIEDLYRVLIRYGQMPPWTLNRTIFFKLPSPKKRIGEILVGAGAVTPDVVSRSLKIKERIFEELGVRVAVGQIFRTVGRLSVIDFFQVLGHQQGIPFKTLDESAPVIFAATRIPPVATGGGAG